MNFILITFLLISQGCWSASLPALPDIVSTEISLNTIVLDSDSHRDTEEHGISVDVKRQALTSAKSGAKPASQTECDSDDECPRNSYCYDTKVCAPCYNCSVYYRYHSNSGCAKTPQMCGSCVIGYQDEILTDGRVRGTCTQIPTIQPATVVSTGSLLYSPNAWIFGGFVFIGFIILVVIVAVWSLGKAKNVPFLKFPWLKEGSYQVHLPSAPPLPNKICEIKRDWIDEPFVQDHERTSILSTQATPFNPNNQAGCCGDTHDGAPHTPFNVNTGTGPGYQINNQGPNPPHLTDETTQPSTWTPSPWSEGTLITSFAGLFTNNNNSNAGFDSASTSHDEGAQSNTQNPGPHPLNITVQGGINGSSTVQCNVMVNNIQITEY